MTTSSPSHRRAIDDELAKSSPCDRRTARQVIARAVDGRLAKAAAPSDQRWPPRGRPVMDEASLRRSLAPERRKATRLRRPLDASLRSTTAKFLAETFCDCAKMFDPFDLTQLNTSLLLHTLSFQNDCFIAKPSARSFQTRRSSASVIALKPAYARFHGMFLVCVLASKLLL